MPLVKRNYIGKLLLTLVVVILLVGFTPISKKLLHYVNGSFSLKPYSSLALTTPAVVTKGIMAGSAIPVKLTNHTGNTSTYHWIATQDGHKISGGGSTLANGASTTLSITTKSAVAGNLRISLTRTKIFITVPLLAPSS
jgi:hypothetical protein